MRRSTRYNRPGLTGSSRSAMLLGADGDGSTLTLDFTTGLLDPRLTFTRGSDATFINSQGFVQYADANHVRNSTMLVSTLWAQTTTGTGATTINGDGSVRFNGAGGRVTWLQSVALAAGLQTTFSFQVTAFTNTNLRTSDLFFSGFGFTGQQYFYTDESGTTYSLSGFESLPKTGTNGLGVYSCTATTTGTVCNITFGVDCNGVGRLGDVTIRDPQVQYGTVVPRLVYVPNSSTSAAKWDSPRFDHDPTTLAPKGLLIEGAATNELTNSNAFTSTGWFTTGSGTKTLTPNYATGPDGVANSAWRYQFSQNCALKQLQGSAGTNYANSIWVKSNTGSNTTLALWSGTAQITLTVTTSWTRVQGVSNHSSSMGFDLYNPNAGTCDVLIWGAQRELGSGASSASSYIPTGASTATRVADFCLMTGTNFSSWYQGGTQGTFYADWFGGVREGASGSTNRTVLSTDDVANKHLHLMQTAAAGNLRLRDFGGANQITTANTLTSGARTKGAFGYNGSSASVCLNGGTVATGSSLAFSVAPTWLVIGATSTNGTSLTDANVVLNNSIRQIKYWPTRLPDSTIQNLTL